MAPKSPDFHLAQVADLFRLLGDATRLRVALACLQGPIAVGEIADALDLAPTLVSHHLRLLRAARLVVFERHGKQVLYSAAGHHVPEMLHGIIGHAVALAPDSA